MKHPVLRSNRLISSAILAVLLLCGTHVWGEEEIASVDLTSWATQNISAGSTVNGVYFKSNSTITNGEGWVMSGNASTSSNYIAIPLSNINGSITISITHASSRPQWKNYFKGLDGAATASDISSNPSNMSDNTRPASNTTISTWTINTNKSYGVFYVGKGSNNSVNLESITISTPCEAPTSVTVSGNWHIFPGDEISLTATATGGSKTPTYQWYKDGTDDSHKIAGATSASFTKTDCTFDDAGSYYCKASTGDGCDKISDAHVVKMLRLYVNVGRAGTEYGYIDLSNTDPANHIASGMIFMGETFDYAFSIADGAGHYYGQNNDKTTGAMNSGNCTGWTMDSDQQCWIHTENGATYTFIVDYTNMTLPVVSVEYPQSNQQENKVIYFDNSVLNWSNLHYRIGRTDYTDKYELIKVPGTDNLYFHTTTNFNNLKAWHIANNCGWSGSPNSIYKTNTGDSYAITNSINFEGGAVTQPVITITPADDHSTGTDSQNDNCEFYKYTVMQGMKTHNVEIVSPTGGTVTVSYTDVDNTAKSFTSGDRDLAHTCILTISAAANPSYSLTSLTVNGVSIASGATHILSSDATIEASFEQAKPSFTWTYDSDLKAGGIYPVRVNSTGDGDVTLSIVETLTGIDGTFTAGNPASGNVSIASYPEASTFTLQATSAATANYGEYTETKTVNITTCFADKILYIKDDQYIDAGKSTKPRYYFEQGNVGRVSKDYGSNVSTNSGATIGGIVFPKSTATLSNMLINPYVDNVVKIRLYVKGGGSSRTLNRICYSDTYFSSVDDATNITSGSVIEYESGSSFGSTNTYVDIYPSVLVHAMDYLYLTFSGGVNLYGIVFTVTEGSEPTTIAWTTAILGNTKQVTEGDAPFTYTAAQTGSVMTLGTLTYSSSDTQVATVNPATGEVTVLDNGSSIITATLSASGCYAEAEAYYRVEVAECKDDPCVISAPKTSKCAAESITLTVTDYEEGATLQWYKDGVAVSGETGESYIVTEPGTYQAVASKNCHQHSNSITITNLEAAPTITAIYDYYYIKNNLDDFHSLNLALFEVTNADVVSANFDVSSINCSLVIDDGKVYLRGKPEITANNTINPFTVTVTNSCNGLSASASMELRLLAATAKPTVAWVVVGKEDGGFIEGIVDGQGSGNALFDYLNTTGGYSLTAVNDYSTTDEKAIAQYYSQFDLIVMTDFPNSKTSDDDGKSYTNAVGSLIDKKPMLSMEAFVSAQPNWRISSNPYNPPTLQKKMKLLCAAHQIFDPAVEIGVYPEGGNEYVNVLTNTGGTKTLQGFSPVSIPDFIFIATIDGGSYGELVTCCERQTVIQSRFMILGIESTGMNAMETGAKQMVKQILDYLLIADPLLIADCSLVFDNGGDGAAPGSGDHLWSNAANWGPNHGTMIPSAFHAVRIERSCQVDIADAHASSARLAQGSYLTKTYNGSLEVLPQGALSLTGFIKRTYNNDFLTRYPLEDGDITIHADATGNGALIWGDPVGDVPATVEYYSKGDGANTANPVWQYMGSPFATRMTAIEQYYAAWMCRWSYISNPVLGGTWVWVENEDRIDPFVGYTITQAATKTYSWTAMLNKPDTKVIPLTYSTDAEGFAMVANSWVAPINISAMEAGDFDGAEPTIYIFNAGSYAQYTAGGEPGDATTVDKTSAGQYSAVPVNSAPYVGISTIPPMQGFFVKTTRNGNLTLDYRKIVMDSVNFRSSTTPIRLPRRLPAVEAEAEDAPIVPAVMRLNVESENWGDKVFLLSHSEFGDAYELGWEGKKAEGDARAPYLAVVEPAGEMAVAAVESFDERNLSFRAGSDSEYTFSFEYEGETIYLYDRVTGVATEIRTGNTYAFTATNATPENRFLITTNPPQIMTDVNNVQRDDERSTKAQKFIRGGRLHIFHRGVVYDAQGARVQSRKEGAK